MLLGLATVIAFMLPEDRAMAAAASAAKDDGSFNGIPARYAGDYPRHDATRTCQEWMAQNAFGASSAVVLPQQLRGR